MKVNKDKQKYMGKVKKFKQQKEVQVELYSNSTIVSLMMKRFPDFRHRKQVHLIIKNLKDITPEEFYKGILDIIKRYTPSNEIDKNHTNFFKVMLEMHRYFKKYCTLEEELRAYYTDKLLGIADEYAVKNYDSGDYEKTIDYLRG